MNDWPSVELGNVAEFVRGINFKPDDVVPVGSPGSVACMRTKNVQAALDLSDVWGVGESFVRRPDQILQEGDVLVSSANSWNLVGKCCWVPELQWRASFGGFVSVLRPNRERIYPRFLFRWFASDRIQTTVRSFGQQTTNISNLNIERCLKLSLPLPPLPEQRRIAEVLDRAEALRAKRRAALAQLDTLTQSIFLDLFGDPATNPKGWPRHTLGEVTTKITDGEHLNPTFSSAGMPIVMAGNVLEDEIDLKNCKVVEGSLGEKFRRKCDPELGDLLIVSRGATIGRLCAVGTNVRFCLMGSVILAKPQKGTIDTRFLTAFLKHPVARSALCKTSGSSAQQAIYLKDVKNLVCIVPPISLQGEFALQVAAVDKLKSTHRSSLAKLDALFASLQHRAFRGTL